MDGIEDNIGAELFTNAPGPAAVPRCLSIPEVLHTVLSLAERNTCARCTQVCRAWKDVAKDVLWHSMDSLVPLLQTLAPLENDAFEDEFDVYTFSRTITDKDWSNFASYAASIRHLVVNQERGKYMDSIVLSDAALVQLLLARPSKGPLLPHLVTLNLQHLSSPLSMASFAKLLFSKSLEHIKVCLPENTAEASRMVAVLQDGSILSPNIKSLEIIGHHEVNPPEYMQRTICSVITRLDLRLFSMPTQMLTQSIMDAVVSRTNLEDFRITWWLEDDDAFGYGVNYPPFLPEPLSLNNFQKLVHLEFRGALKELCNVFYEDHIYVTLTELVVEPILSNDEAELCPCIRRICTSCPMLKSLSVRRYHQFEAEDVGIYDSPRQCADIVAFAPLQELFHLEHLYFDHHLPIRCTNKQLIDFARAFPRLRTLHLNPEPFTFTSTGLSTRILGKLASLLPQLEVLRLYINLSGIPSTDMKSGVYRFQKLQELSFGNSALDSKNEGDLLVLLSRVLPRGCELKNDSNLPGFRELYLQFAQNQSPSARRMQWEDFRKTLSTVLRVRDLAENSVM